MEANSTHELVGVFMLLDATSASQPKPGSYSLSGHEPELTKYNGSRVEVTGSLMPKATSARSEKGAPATDAMQRIRVDSVKKLDGPACSAAKK
jgi:hypothetical protein